MIFAIFILILATAVGSDLSFVFNSGYGPVGVVQLAEKSTCVSNTLIYD